MKSHLTTHPPLVPRQSFAARAIPVAAAAVAGALLMGLIGTTAIATTATPEYRVQISREGPGGASIGTTAILGPGGQAVKFGSTVLGYDAVDVTVLVESRRSAGGEWEPVTPGEGAPFAGDKWLVDE